MQSKRTAPVTQLYIYTYTKPGWHYYLSLARSLGGCMNSSWMRSAGVLHVQRADRASERGPFDAQGLRSIIANNARRRRRGSKKIIHCAGERRFASAAHSEKRVLCVSWIGVQLRGPTHPACMTSKSHFLHVSHTRICTSKIICICF